MNSAPAKQLRIIAVTVPLIFLIIPLICLAFFKNSLPMNPENGDLRQFNSCIVLDTITGAKAAWKFKKFDSLRMIMGPFGKDTILKQNYINNAIDKHTDTYRSAVAEIQWSMNAMLILICISLYFLIGKSQRIKLPFVDKEASIKWLFWAAPPLFCYLWLQFGFAFYNGIQHRLVLMDLTYFIDIAGFPKTHSVNYTYEDNSILDFFFQHKHPFYASQGTFFSKGVSAFVFLTGYGIFLGLFHSLFLIYSKKWIMLFHGKNGPLFLFFAVIFLGIFCISHFSFYYSLPALWDFQVILLSFAIAIYSATPLKRFFNEPLATTETGDKS
jgi:hypothetical protein